MKLTEFLDRFYTKNGAMPESIHYRDAGFRVIESNKTEMMPFLEQIAWCNQNLPANSWLVIYEQFIFENESDAIAFMLGINTNE